MFSKRLWTVLLLIGLAPASVMALGDPTKPPFHSTLNNAAVIEDGDEVAPELMLSSILISPNRRVAVINGQILKRNELIQGVRIVAIEPGRVLLDNAGKKIELFLLSDMKRKVGGMNKL